MIRHMQTSYPCVLNKILFSLIVGLAIVAGMLKHEVGKHAAEHHAAEQRH